MTTDNTILLTGEERDAYIAKRFNEKLTGQALLDYVEANTATMNRVELCAGAGYERKFTEFYESILDARNANGEYKVVTNGEYYEMNGRDWYEDVLDDQGRALYDAIEERCPEFSKLDAEQCQEFMDELSEHGITEGDQFRDAHYYQTDSWNAESEFAQYYAEEIACMNQFADAGMLSMLVIDWQATWDCSLRYDFCTIEFDGETYFFSNNF